MACVRVCGSLGLAALGTIAYIWATHRSTPRKAVRDGRKRMMVVCSGSVAAVKVAELVRILIEEHKVFVDLVLSRSGNFFQDVEYRDSTGRRLLERLQRLRSSDSDAGSSTPWLEVWLDEDEWNGYKNVGDSVLHIDLAKRNHLLLFAPLCAHSLAQLAGGSAGTLALSVARAWASDLEECFAGQVRERCGRHCVEKPLVVAPAMNTVMWHQNVTQEHLSVLRRRKVVVVDPVEKVLACGDRGRGAMAGPHDIADLACQLLDAHEEALAAARRSGLPEFLP